MQEKGEGYRYARRKSRNWCLLLPSILAKLARIARWLALIITSCEVAIRRSQEKTQISFDHAFRPTLFWLLTQVSSEA